MHLQKIEIQGFKSFARKKILEFRPSVSRRGKGIVAVVGPNGSGKSNVADAIRWALGEQSMKALRGKKSEDIIFSGSSALPRLGLAEVTLCFNNEDGQAPIDYAELAVTRRIFRSGEGEYLINKGKARLQDIVMLLAKANFGQGSYSIIGQGMIDAILRASPLERKAFFDEATGVKQYQIKREQAIRKLEAAVANLQQTEITLNEIEPRLRSLTRQVKKLERREAIEEELRGLQGCYFSKLWQELSGRAEGQNRQIKSLEEERERIQGELRVIRGELEKLRQGETRQQIFSDLQGQYDRIAGEKNSLLREQSVIRGRMDLEHEKMGQVNVAWLENRREALEREMRGILEEAASLDGQIEKEEGLLAEKTAEREAVGREMEKYGQELEKSRAAKELSWPELRANLEEAYDLNRRVEEDLGGEKISERLGGLKELVRSLSKKLSDLIGEIKDYLSKNERSGTEERRKTAEFSRDREELAGQISEIKIALQVKKEKKILLGEKSGNLKAEKEKISAELDKNRSIPLDKGEKLSALTKETEALAEKIGGLDGELRTVKARLDDFNRLEQEKKEKMFSSQRQLQDKQGELDSAVARLNDLRVELAKLETKKEDLEEEIKSELNIESVENAEALKVNEELFGFPEEEAIIKIQRLKSQMEMIGGIDAETAREYAETKERFDFLSEQTGDLRGAIESLKKIIKDLNEKISRQFNSAFEKINREFERYFKMLFNGGSAKLVLQKNEKKDEGAENAEGADGGEDDEKAEGGQIARARRANDFSDFNDLSGIEIQATPPGKRLKHIGILSGGERALTSIALICAILSHNPSPFVVLDEVDAALDEANSLKFAAIIEELSQKTQFVVITHNRSTMEKADILYGVTMGDDGTSQLLSINLEEALKSGNR